MADLPWLLPSASPAPPGIAADQAALGALVVRAASVVGAGHRCEEPAAPRQDAYRVARDRAGEYLIIAVADGVAESTRADLGAAVAVSHAVGLLRARIDRGVRIDDLRAEEVFTQVATAIVEQARERGLSLTAVQTTLAVAVVSTRAAPHRVWAGTLGDTALWQRELSGWRQLTGKRKGQVGDNALDGALPSHAHLAVDCHLELSSGDVLAVLTDGVHDAFELVDGAAEWFARRWAQPPPLASFLLDVDYAVRSLQDDRTAVVVWTSRATEETT